MAEARANQELSADAVKKGKKKPVTSVNVLTRQRHASMSLIPALGAMRQS